MFALFFVVQACLSYAQTADFSASSTVGCTNFSVNFTDQSNPMPVSWRWDFGNGSTSNSQNPSAIYTSTGQYTVTMEVTFSGGQVITVTKAAYIKVYTKPTVNFTAALIAGCQPLSVPFTSQATPGSAPIRNYTWDFGNGVSSNSQNPIYFYGQSGTYNVSLQVEDTNGCTSIATKSNYINVKAKPNASFSSTNNNHCSYPAVASMVNTTIANAPGALTYDWDMGNGQTTGATNPSLQYMNPGSYDVRLIATNSLGCKDTVTRLGYVNLQDLKANFTSNKQSGCPPFIVDFQNTSTPVIAGAQYSWTFGNGGTSKAEDTSYSYNLPGNYSVSLKMTSPTGCVDSVYKTYYITAFNKPTANFTVNDSAACKAPLNAAFQASPTGISSYKWTFGDGTSSTLQNPTKVYNDTGFYSVNLIVTGTNGCNDTSRRINLMKIRRPRADFKPNILGGCAPLDVDFSNTSQSVAPLIWVSYRFEDGTTSNSPFPTHTFNDTGYYNPWIRIRTDDGCVDSAQYDTIGVGMQPTPDFTADSLAGCRKMEVNFTNLTNQGPIKADKFEWITGAGAILTEENPKFSFETQSKFYDIMLIAYHHGCADTMEKKSYIQVYPPTSIFQKYTAGCNADSVYFDNLSVGGTQAFWDFGDGDTSYSWNVSHTYSAGTYKATLIMHDSVYGCKDTSETLINVASNDNLKFRADTTVCTRKGIWFFDQTPGSSGWEWNFGTGKTYTSRNVFIEFDEPGFYDVAYSAIVQGCRSSTIKHNYLHVYGPKFDIQTNPDPVCAPANSELICFVGGERPVNRRGMSILDGFNILYEDTSLTKDTVNYTFTPRPPQDSVFQVFYYAYDTAGCFNLKYDTVRAYRPLVDFTETPIGSCDGTLLQYDVQNLDSTSPGPLHYIWDYGDGQGIQIDSMYTEHLYTQNGLIDVRLIAQDSYGCADTVIKPKLMEIRPIAAGIDAVQRYQNCPPFFVNFRDTSNDTYQGINKWDWYFSDGSFSSVKNPSKFYNEPGKYWAALRVTDTLGCTDSIYVPDFIEVGGTKINYTLSAINGCEPLEIEVKSTAIGNAEIKWDMNDGSNVIDSSDFKYTYQNAGVYIPIAFVKDLSGCQYNLPLVDTIKVAESPNPDFLYSMACLGSPASFSNLTSVFGNGIQYLWDFGTGVQDTAESPTYIFPNSGDYTVKLKAENADGCGQSISKDIFVPVVDAQLKLSDSRSCTGNAVDLDVINSGIGKTIQVSWRFDDGSILVSPDSVLQHNYQSKGIYKPWAIVLNEYGCYDTTQISDSIVVGDNFPPSKPFIYSSSVLDNNSTGTRFEPINSIDFTKYIYYRQNSSGTYDSIGQSLTMSDTFFQDLVPTLDQAYRYKVQAKNFCGFYSDLNTSVPHRTIDLEAKTADDASYLSWNAYEGWNVMAYDVYRLNDQGDFVWIKEVPGNRTEAYDSAIVCNRGYYYKIHARGNSDKFKSWSDTSGAIPNYIPFVPENELLWASIEKENRIEVKWTKTVGGKVPVDSYLLERSNDGSTYYPVKAKLGANDFSFMDALDSAKIRPFYYRVMAKDSCGYIAKPSNYGRTMILNISMDSLDRPKLSWMPYQDWDEGVEEYRIEIFDNGSFQFLDVVHGSKLTYTDKTTQLNGRKDYCYRVTALSSEDGGKYSKSNIGCAQVRSRLFVPSAFRPKGQVDNQTFRPKGMYVESYSMQVINRWGERLFLTEDMEEGWDGTYNGDAMSDGVYFYIIDYTGTDGSHERLSGSVYLIR